MSMTGGWIELTSANSNLEAEWLVGALKNLGIEARTFGGGLADEFAMSQKLMGLGGGVRVMVPKESETEARAALAQFKPPAPEEPPAPDPQVHPAPRPRDRSIWAIAFLGAGLLVLGLVCLDQRRQLRAWEQQGPLSRSELVTDGLEEHWTSGEGLRARHYDRDHNLIYEEAWVFNRQGVLMQKHYDADQDGTYERFLEVTPEGTVLCSYIDNDQDGAAEQLEFPPHDGVIERWLDLDQDRRFERWEFRDASDGRLLDAFELRGREGCAKAP